MKNREIYPNSLEKNWQEISVVYLLYVPVTVNINISDY